MEAETSHWAKAFCTRLVRLHPQADKAWALLLGAHQHLQSLVIGVHPTLAASEVSLGKQLLELPQCMHTYACRTALSSQGSGAADTLTFDAKHNVESVRLLADALSGLEGIHELQLSDAEASKESWAAITAVCTAAAVPRISLTRCRVSDDDVLPPLLTSLAAAATVVSLTLASCSIYASGAAALAPLLPMLSHLQMLSLRSNGLQNAGAAALGPALAQLLQLTMLDLSSTQIGNAGAADMAPHLAKMTALKVLDMSVRSRRISTAHGRHQLRAVHCSHVLFWERSSCLQLPV